MEIGVIIVIVVVAVVLVAGSVFAVGLIQGDRRRIRGERERREQLQAPQPHPQLGHGSSGADTPVLFGPVKDKSFPPPTSIKFGEVQSISPPPPAVQSEEGLKCPICRRLINELEGNVRQCVCNALYHDRCLQDIGSKCPSCGRDVS